MGQKNSKSSPSDTPSAGIINHGNITANLVVPAYITGNSNIVNINHTSPPVALPDRIEFNVQDSVESFTGREDVIKQLHHDIEKNIVKGIPTVVPQITIISGMGGVGKTETVRKYIQLYKANYGHVLWINAENYSEARSCFLKLAALIRITLRDLEGKPKHDWYLAEEIYNFVCTKASLIVFDNAQSLDAEGNEIGIKPWLPKTVKVGWELPAIVVTTRDRKWNHIPVVELQGFTEEECYSLLISQLNFPDSEENRKLASQITELCEGLPLVVQQVIAVIREETAETSGPYGMREFIHDVEDQKANLIQAKPADSAVGDSVFTIFEITFKILGARNNGKLALQCLDVMSLLNPDNMPGAMLQKLITIKEARKFAEAMNLLRRFNLTTRCEGFYKVHRMIQAVTLNSSVTSSAEEKQNVINVTVNLFKDFLQSQPNTTDNIHEVLDNGVRLVKNDIKLSREQDHNEVQQTLAKRVHEVGRYNNAIELYGHIAKQQERKLGDKHLETIFTKRNLASAIRQHGEYDKSAEIFKNVIQSMVETIGPFHPYTIDSASGLAEVYQRQGKYKQAENLYLDVLESRKKLLGENHPATMITKSDLVIVYNALGKLEKAETLNLEAYNHLVTNFGPDNPDTLTTRHNLAVGYKKQGRYDEAELIWKDVSQRRQKILGAIHPFTMTSQCQLASVYIIQNKYEEAEGLYQQILPNQEKLLGPNHPNTMASKSNLALIFLYQGKYAEVEALYQTILLNQEATLGPTDPGTMITKNNIGVLCINQGKYHEAEIIFDDAVKTKQKILPENHPEILRSKNHLGTVYLKLGQYDKAESIYLSVLQKRNKILGETHADTMTTKNNLATVYVNQGRHHEAEGYYCDVLQNRSNLLGQSHKDTITTIHDLSVLYNIQRKYEQAEQVLQEQVLPVREKILGPNHPDTLATKHLLATVYKIQNKFDRSTEVAMTSSTTES